MKGVLQRGFQMPRGAKFVFLTQDPIPSSWLSV